MPRKRKAEFDSIKDVSECKEDESKNKKSNLNREMLPSSRLTATFFNSHSCEQLAKQLLGKLLCRRLADTGEVVKGIIVETESYLGVEDGASMTFKGKVTPRNEPMFMKPGTCFVYFTYGMYHIFNVSSVGEGAAVLLRALQPLDGIQTMRSLRKRFNKKSNGKEVPEKQLCNGPAKLCIAMGINKEINKVDAIESDLIWFEDGDSIDDQDIVLAPRIGINVAPEWKFKPLRFYIKDNEFVSVRDKKAEAAIA